MQVTALQPQWEAAQSYLQTLSADTHFTFQAIAERPDVKPSKSSKVTHGTWDDCRQELAQKNAQGFGIFVTVNETDGKGRKASNIVRVRSHFIDLDGAPVQPVLQAAHPHMVVESSPGKWHVYWLTEDCPLDQFKPRQQLIAQQFGGDTSVCDLPRVMRLPGFWHQKHERPFLTRLVPRIEWDSLMETPE
ncbi:MAG TPA: DNA-primase RepB domain-containing protein [Alicycliphilus sp.]|jgi:hypothetical protein|nr:DNA-primase RepB domain-containing protein [Alicycliphilus sp.]